MAGIVRVARDLSAVIVKVGESYHRISADLTNVEQSDELAALTNVGAWRKPVSLDLDKFKEHVSLASGDIVEPPKPERQIRLPKAVQSAIVENVDQLSSNPEERQYLYNFGHISYHDCFKFGLAQR